MATATKGGSLLATLVLVAIIGGVALNQGSKGKNDDSVRLALSVVWKGERPINIKVSVNGISAVDETHTKSPWNRVTVIKRSDRLTMGAYQADGGNLDCFIAVVDTPGFVSTSNRADPGSVRCYYPAR